MKNIDSFSSYHPLINFLYFALVLVFTMCFMNPVSLAISLFSALCYGINLNGAKTTRFAVVFILPMMIMTAIINPVFNHEGMTILTYLPSGNPLTLESILYGLASSSMLASIIIWFTCYTAVMTSDKFVYLFGRIIPALSLVLSMTLRFVPKFQAQFNVVSECQKALGRDANVGNIFDRMKKQVTILSIMITWSLENAIESADSMKSRGYGLPNRTAFSIYKFDSRDKIAMAWLIFVGFFIISIWMAGGFYNRYFPTFAVAQWNVFTVIAQIMYLLLCLTPVILNEMENKRWKYLQSKI